MTTLFFTITFLFTCHLSGILNPINQLQAIPAGYRLDAPAERIFLPDVLREVSGVAVIDRNTLAFVQDEKGIVFLYDFQKRTIKREILFTDEGDFEDLAMVNNTIYVLRSDGTLYEITNFNSPDYQVRSYKTGIPCKDNEGLCYDPKNNRLLIGCKGKIEKEELENKRVVYAFDLKLKKLIKNPVFVFDPRAVRKFTKDKKVNLQGKDEDHELSLRTSAIGINPLNGRLYLLSADDYCLFVFSEKGKTEFIISLDKELYNKAEGLAFLPDGKLLVTNEGEKGKPTLVVINRIRTE